MPVMIVNEVGEPIGIDYPEYDEPEFDDIDMDGYYDDYEYDEEDEGEAIDATGDAAYPDTDLWD